MNAKSNTPVTHTDAELIFKLLDIITSEIHRLFDFGALQEDSGDYEIDKTLSKIASKQDEIRRLRQLVTKTRGYVKHRRTIEKQRQRK